MDEAFEFRSAESGRRVVAVPPGRYLVGDPCYAFSGQDGRWDRILEATNTFMHDGDAAAGSHSGTVDGVRVVAFHTLHGDGTFRSDDGRVVAPVDAGLIGLVEAGDAAVPPGGMSIIEFHDAAECFEADGIIYIGDLAFDTSDRAPDFGEEEDSDEAGADRPRH